MKKLDLYLCLAVACPVSLFSQISPMAVPKPAIVFNYDEAGNQIYRGYNGISVLGEQVKAQEEPVGQQSAVPEQDPFWLGVQIYPVPVQSVLTISWNEENDAVIDHVSLYQHSTLAHLFQKKNLPNLNREVQIDMTHYYMGVYVLTFQLKDGRTLSRNITKL